ncbi:MAG: Wzz/FepE/Etk N-terminal domain-containing protein [Ekhidna sp.]|nr:Wzz/FepE/Etk N-terminal domain-containing protein [Ekhidna sp.]
MAKKEEIIKENEVDLIELLKSIWLKRLFIAKVSSIFFILGITIAFTSKVEYKSSCKLFPQSEESRTLNLNGLSRLGLLGLGGNFDDNNYLTPNLYPEIVRSTPFLDKLINTPVYFEKLDTAISSYDYFTKFHKPSLIDYTLEYTIGLPGKIFKKDKNSIPGDNSQIKRYSNEKWGLIRNYAKRLSVSVDPETSIVTIETELPDPTAAAMITTHLVENLTKNIIEYKIEKAKFNLSFIQERFIEVEKEYKIKQKQLARFSDRNRNITNSIVQNEYERLKNDLDISFEVYKGLAIQLEQAKIEVKKETPVFVVLEPAKVPVNKSKPKKKIIILVSFFLGFLTSVVVVVVKNRT